ncbi:GCN5 family acetyltransferase [Thalassospira lucentensis]|jgi:putative acetyltransferase|uniref:GCN5 family acetyltransferase n=2 Tax=Thalassospira TaxID=168934 RepID=A0A154KX37_9PROT|nr:MULTISPECIES: N-acetyltransferase [Thalassospira]KZB56178.1 GCN5 family acetyltransferase [Thalassospira xiamenensis]KZB62965.1 GCN5 family acetyltransferase [Thalassospira lucentensis]MAZ34440.1 N-acetyltransferase [Thalassospira sp.]MBO9508373.1 N-acetyltransferase [Thalassospira sp. A3_1]MCH2274768.1 N-acetyltransferase [Thalassospira sp.]|tara:strand:- start:84 stop:590 length:507 start_codon:yes stop_codon:yes gene_type:complete
MLIRDETEADIPAIHALLANAFATAPHSQQTEHLIVDALRDKGRLSLSLVAIEDDELVGCVAFSPVKIDGQESDWFGLGPVAVNPDRQGLGIGSELIQAGIARLRINDAAGCVVLGEPDYYSRFGFAPLPDLKLEGVPDQYFMARPLIDTIPAGNVDYDPAFYIAPQH